jgi:hypothetical protein
MSVVTNIIIAVNGYHRSEIGDVAKLINAYFDDKTLYPWNYDPMIALDDPSVPNDRIGGNKYLEVRLFVGAFNHLNADSFVDYLKNLP